MSHDGKSFNLKGKTVTIIGSGRSGQAAARLVVRLGGRPKISDCGPEQAVDPAFLQWAQENGVLCEWDGNTQRFIEYSDLVVLSPGVPIDSDPVAWSRAKGVPVIAEIELAFRVCEKPVIAVTGSNGKTTVCNLITEVLKQSGDVVCLCGNVGTPFCDYVLDGETYDYYVLEVSSFQLESIDTFKPLVAVLLNFNENHLDRHASMQEYFDAKRNIFRNQGESEYAVINDVCRQEGLDFSQVRAHVLYFNEESAASAGPDADNPNYQAVRCVANILNKSDDTCTEVFAGFKGIEHRLEPVGQIDNVQFINDSKATTAQSTLWALTRMERPVVMICGGRDKHIDFSVITNAVQQKVKKIIAIGEAREKIIETFSAVVPVESAEDLTAAVNAAFSVSAPGDCVLLSPMCASFDMFDNYEHRGRSFKDIVLNQLMKNNRAS